MASVLKAPYVTAKHGLIGFCSRGRQKRRAVQRPLECGFARVGDDTTDRRQLPDLARSLGISEDEAIKTNSARTVDGKDRYRRDIARIVLFLAAFPDGAMTGQYVNQVTAFVMP